VEQDENEESEESNDDIDDDAGNDAGEEEDDGLVEGMAPLETDTAEPGADPV
jgi:hypothetical protein